MKKKDANKKKTKRSLRTLRRDTKGAVLAEFVVAIFPLLAVFFVFVQLSYLAIAGLIVKHSAVVGARAAAVFANEHKNVPELCDDDGKGKVEDAVRASLGPWSNRITPTTEITDKSSKNDDDGVYDLVTVKVSAQVKCNIPLGKAICGIGGYHQFIDTKSMSHQGARYKTRQCDGGGSQQMGVGNGQFIGGGGRSGGGGASGSF